ncbi:MAG: hypothetical protein RL347_2220, partial [Actinomycetota bacterium]
TLARAFSRISRCIACSYAAVPGGVARRYLGATNPTPTRAQYLLAEIFES